MIDAQWLVSAVGFAVSMTATPGPNNAMVAASAANFGLRRTWAHVFGIAVGFPLMVVMVALGAGALLRAAPWIGGALRLAGAAYLLVLAWKIATSRPRIEGRAGGRPLSFWQAAAFQWVNPKAWVIAVGGVAAFTTGASVAEPLLLALVFLAITVPLVASWAAVGAGAGLWLRRGNGLLWFNRAMAVLLVGSVGLMFAE